MHERHARALDAQVHALRREPDVVAALLQGSVARGDAHPGSDLDLLVVLADDGPPAFRHALVEGVRVEQHRASMPALTARLKRRPGLAHGIVEARCLFDRAGVVDALRDHATSVLASHVPDPGERARLAYWLRTAAEKVEAAREGGDWFRASLVATTTTWPLIEALWAVNGSPAPTVGSVPMHLARLPRQPAGCRDTFARLLLGDAPERTAAFVELARWAAAALDAAPGDGPDGPTRESHGMLPE
jgi:hypothetical protein